MMRKCKSLILVWMLAFLQCLAPLLHAHAGGLHAATDAHIHFHGPLLAKAHGQLEFSMHHVDAPSVSAPAQFKRDPIFSPSSADLAFAVAQLPQPAFAAMAFTAPQALLPRSGFTRPAPPARAPPAAFTLIVSKTWALPPCGRVSVIHLELLCSLGLGMEPPCGKGVAQ